MKQIRMKTFWTALLCVWAFGSSVHAAEKVRISVTNYNMSYLGAGVAAKKGFFIEEGLDVEIVRMNAKVIKGLIKANRFIRENRDESVKILAEWGRTQKEDAADAYDSTRQVFSPDGSMIEEGMRLVIEDAKKALKVTRPVTLTEVSDTGALREAQRELGLKSR